ncbi:NAD(P)/FAD-dependent oxidoreductase [Herbiconiux daphne]|uniref:NAD(P)/FAD-dependent oxidoreductase n=1 Tax=Herbiconiux daphne TaxID=2970914 RepID=A0ABT2H501_9MICO|nr:NAD(P)/FAD-dependent oxidoreductase [Herbiconiux daphne]MCS5735001.1 NAD(P)/FAD-dependent oxidoreductase [Herbiconiux daphne]
MSSEVLTPYGGDRFEAIIIGGGPAGLSVGLNLVRARRRVLILDSNRPRHSATLISHGFLTRDGVSPLELRALGREEFSAYPDAEFHQGLVDSITPPEGDDAGGDFLVVSRGVRGSADRRVTAPVVVLANGLSETLPALPSMRAYYGTSLHSCIECDAYEKAGEPLALIGETADLAERALLISQVTGDLIVFTNGSDAVTAAEEAGLGARGVAVDRREIADVVGDRSGLTGVALADGTVVPRTGGFVRPIWSVPLGFASQLDLVLDGDGFVVVSDGGATSVPGVFAAGDITPPGPQQLIVAAGAGARVAASVNRHLLGAL